MSTPTSVSNSMDKGIPRRLTASLRAWFRRDAAPSLSTPEDPARLAVLGAARRALRHREALYRQLIERQQPRARADIARWREALAAWHHPERPNPRPMLALYDDVVLDAHLTSLLNTRRLRVMGATLRLIGPDGEPDASQAHSQALVEQAWVRQLVGYILDSRWWGQSVIELTTTEARGIAARLLPRTHLVPQLGLLTLDPAEAAPPRADQIATDGPWLRLTDLVAEGHALVIAGSDAEPGLLAHAIPYVVMKRHALACWSEFAEVFGMPMRIAHSPGHDRHRKEQLAQMLKDMGSAAYVVLDEGEQIELKDNARADAFRVYDRLVERCNQELSKLLHGQTLTTEAGDRGARSLGEIHDRIFDDITRADVRFVEQTFNDQVMPLVARFPGWRGLPLGTRFAIDLDAAVLSLPEQWAIDSGLLAHFTVAPDYFRRKYGLPILGPR